MLSCELFESPEQRTSHNSMYLQYVYSVLGCIVSWLLGRTLASSMTPDAQDSSIPKLLNLIQTKNIYEKEIKEKVSSVDSHQAIQTTAVMRPKANENSRTKHMEFSFHLN